MNAALRIHGHFVFFEAEIGDALLEHSNKKVVGEMVLVGEADRRDSFQPAKEILVQLLSTGSGVERVIGEFIVKSIIATRGGALGKIAEIRLVLLIEKRVLCGEAVGNRRKALSEGRTG